jgi:hypothetical protein
VDNNNGRSAGEIGRPRADLDWRVGPWRVEEESKEEEVKRGREGSGSEEGRANGRTPSGETHLDSQPCSLRLTALPALKMIGLIGLIGTVGFVGRPAGRQAPCSN